MASLAENFSSIPPNTDTHNTEKQKSTTPPKKTSSTTATTENPVLKDRNAEKAANHHQGFAVLVKSEYMLTAPHSSLAPRDSQIMNDPNDRRASKTDQNDDRSEGRGKKGKRGMNTKRARDGKVKAGDQLCHKIIHGDACTITDCHFSHDLVAYLKGRPVDLKERCYVYDTFGFCRQGITCRSGSCHINLETGENLKRPDSLGGVITATPTMNCLPHYVAGDLRKNKFPFVCQRNESNFVRKDVKVREAKKADEASFTLNKINPRDPDDITAANMKKNEEISVAAAAAKALRMASAVVDNSAEPAYRKLIDFSGKVYIAPLTTVGNLPFRRIMKRFGADITCGEMALCGNLLQGNAAEWALTKRHPSEDIFGVQLASGHADQFTRVSEVIEKHCEVDFIDMNCGCPIDLVCNMGAGAAFMQKKKKLRDSVIGMYNSFSGPVSIKIRTGWAENSPCAHDLVPAIQSWDLPNINCVFMHGRSRLQRYSKLANWDYIGKVADAQEVGGAVRRLPVIGNGDILSFTDFEEKKAKGRGINDTAMLARGALIKPWLPTEIKEKRHWDISATERLEFIKDFVNFGLVHWGADQQGVNTTRRFLLEWLSFLCRYVPLGLMETESIPQRMNERPPKYYCGRSDLETLMLSDNCQDWVALSEIVMGKVPDDFEFTPKHKSNAY